MINNGTSSNMMAHVCLFRTGKRDWRGMVNDATNSLARIWTNTTLDFFKQAVLDYVLGVNLGAIAQFEHYYLAADPGEIIRLTTIRQLAIETCTNIVVEKEDEEDSGDSDGQGLKGGWTLLCPPADGADPTNAEDFEEKVTLLTSKALYVCGYEYTLQKVSSFSFCREFLADIDARSANSHGSRYRRLAVSRKERILSRPSTTPQRTRRKITDSKCGFVDATHCVGPTRTLCAR
jgi:hypothetical protein